MQHIAPIAALAVSFLALLISWINYRSEHTTLTTSLRRDWEALSTDWNRAILLHRGWDDVYSTSSMDTRKEVRKLIRTVRNTKNHDLSFRLATIAAERAGIERLRRYFYSVSDLALNGKISIKELYGIFGPEFARHRQLLAWLVGDDKNDDYKSDDEWVSLRGQLIISPFHQETRQLRLLHTMVWAECIARGDTYAHLMMEHAIRLAADRSKHQLDALVLLTERWRLYAYLQWGWHLRKTVKIPIRSLARGGPLLGEIDTSRIAWAMPKPLKVRLLRRMGIVEEDYHSFQ